MLVKEIMNKVITIEVGKSVREASIIMNEFRIGSLIVVDENGKAVGILTERDILVHVVAKGVRSDTVNVEDAMTKKMIVVGPDTTLEDAAEVMTKYKIKKLPIVQNGALVGIITATDLIMYEKKLLDKVAQLFVGSRPSQVGG